MSNLLALAIVMAIIWLVITNIWLVIALSEWAIDEIKSDRNNKMDSFGAMLMWIFTIVLQLSASTLFVIAAVRLG